MIEKLLKIQQELKVPKNRTNSFGGYKYRSCEDIVEAAKPLCHAEGMMLFLFDEVVEVGGRVYVKATAELTDGKSCTFRATGWAREAETKKGMDEAQITGSASSYARKYALNGLFAIDDVADADATNTHGKLSLDEAFTILNESTTVEELTANFRKLSPSLQKDPEIIAKCAEIKKTIINQ